MRFFSAAVALSIALLTVPAYSEDSEQTATQQSESESGSALLPAQQAVDPDQQSGAGQADTGDGNPAQPLQNDTQVPQQLPVDPSEPLQAVVVQQPPEDQPPAVAEEPTMPTAAVPEQPQPVDPDTPPPAPPAPDATQETQPAPVQPEEPQPQPDQDA